MHIVCFVTKHNSLNVPFKSLAAAMILERAELRARIQALKAELATQLSLEDTTDLRLGSIAIEIVNGSADITLQLEESDDLGNTDAWEATGTPVTVTVPASAEKRFFRFGE